ncbi:YgjP-like metallopeptidase domain-containing protein [Novosphingobium colocasiae]
MCCSPPIWSNTARARGASRRVWRCPTPGGAGAVARLTGRSGSTGGSSWPPDAVRRSVVAHEVAHLIHFDHSPAFHAALAELFEGSVDEANRWLSRQGRTLYLPFG